MGIIDAALEGIGGGINAGLGWADKQQQHKFDEKKLAQQADLASAANTRALILQELKNSGLLDSIGARGDQSVRVEGVKGANAQDLEGVKQTGRINLADKNFGNTMELTSFKEGAATDRNNVNDQTRRYGIDTGASTQRRSQDVSARTQRRGQNMSFGASEYATDSANRRSLVPRPNTAMPFGGVELPKPSYDQFFEPPPEMPDQASPDPTAPVSAQPQVQVSPKPGPAVAPVPPPRRAAPAPAQGPVAPVPPTQPPAGAARPAPQAAAPTTKYQPGQTVTLRNGKKVTIKKINPDGTFDY